MGRFVKVLALAAVTLAATASSGAAAPRAHAPKGVVPHGRTPHSLSGPATTAAPTFLTYDTNYETLIDQYLTDVAHDSGGASNVYSVATQYSDGSGNLLYQSTFGGATIDNDPLPANGCDDGQDPVCLTDVQLQAEIQNVLTAKGLHGSDSALFVLLTPNGVGGCFDGTGAECTTNTYCAYHNDFFDSSGEPVIYANEPYNATIDGCDPGSSPNSDDADATINTLSHEANEAITDPFGDGWWRNSDQQENGDLCAWGFGTALGGSGGTQYNQVINGHDYWLQQEYSNADHGCLQRPGGTVTHVSGGTLDYHGGLVMHTNTTYAIYWLPTSGSVQPPVVSGTAAVNQTLSSSPGAWNGAPTGYSYQWQRCSAAGAGCADIPGATSSTYALTTADGGQYVRSTVSATNVNGASPYTASATHLVAPLPAATGQPALSGVAAVGRTLSTSSGTWNTAATFAYQWLRCSIDGSSCTAISGATSSTHVLAGADAGHRLEASVSATNPVGTVQVVSQLSGIVIAAPRVTKAPHVSGRARVGKRLSATHGSWSGPPTSYRYQWLRCNAHGSACRSIRHATKARYRLTKLDAKHRLRVRVTAVNAAGSKLATSRPTARVPA
jgi:hypothetical protein